MLLSDWSRTEKMTLLALLIAAVACAAALIVVPEVRNFIGLDPARSSSIAEQTLNSNSIASQPKNDLQSSSASNNQVNLQIFLSNQIKAAEASSITYRTAKIIDIGRSFPSMNQTDCLQWPDEETRKLGGKSGWGTFKPKNGDVGSVVVEAIHCDKKKLIKVYILKIGDYYVPIASRGVSLLKERKS